MSSQNPHTGDIHHSQIPMGCPTPPPPTPSLGLDIDRYISKEYILNSDPADAQ